ncbi:MAG: ribonuclease domain-containing protein [Micropruina sp.]|uniref:ribonuclease domain-containing protein n=1 Tax=Micropruina sp. TaxID=2737536 RepID=UPI0039E3DB1F
MRPGSWQRLLLVVGLVVVLVFAGIQWRQADGGEPAAAPTASGSPVATRSATPVTSSPVTPPDRSEPPACSRLPAEVSDAVAAVRNDGPYLRPRDDGGTFGNREGLLPAKPRGYYREYTVLAPGQKFPGPRRLVTGGQPRLGTEPVDWFYTSDHYESFCQLRP